MRLGAVGSSWLCLCLCLSGVHDGRGSVSSEHVIDTITCRLASIPSSIEN